MKVNLDQNGIVMTGQASLGPSPVDFVWKDNFADDGKPADLTATGSPSGSGAGRTPPLWLKVGDTLEVELSGVGVLRNPVVAEG